MSEEKKAVPKWTMALLALLGLAGAGAGVDAAGYDPTQLDIPSLVGTLKDLGLLGLGALIWYLHKFWYPHLVQANARLGLLVERSETSQELHSLAEQFDARTPLGRQPVAPQPDAVPVAASAAPQTGPLRMVKGTP